MKVYSKVDEIEIKKASDEIVEGCMVLEGGALRGVYTAGVLDVLMENGINMRTTVGVSAGALNALSYVGGHIGRAAMCDLRYRHDKRFIGIPAYLESGSLTGFSFMFREFTDAYPLDKKRLFRGDRKLYAAATEMESGEVEYFENVDDEHKTFFRAVCASSSMPFCSKKIRVGDKYYLDGGCSVKIPIRFALEREFEKIIVINTREASYRRRDSGDGKLPAKLMYGKYPKFVQAFCASNRVYNEDCDLLDKLSAEGRIFRIAPSEPVTVSRLESDTEKLGELYHLGRRDGEAAMPKLREYLGL